MNILDSFSQAYRKEFHYALDNELILNWYPKRIMKSALGESLLELGIGHGYSTERFAKHYKRHVVVDGSPEIIGQFQQQFPDCKAEIVCDYFEKFDTDELFDVIVMGFVLEHVDDPVQILKRYRKFLNPNGTVFVTVPNAQALNKRIGLQAGIIDDLYALSEADIAQGHQRLFSIESLKQLVVSAGYKPLTIEGMFLKPITTTQIKELALTKEILNAMMTVGIDYPELCVGLLMQIDPLL